MNCDHCESTIIGPRIVCLDCESHKTLNLCDDPRCRDSEVDVEKRPDLALPHLPGHMRLDCSDQHALPPGYNASSEKLCTDYLAALRKHTELVLQHKLPSSIMKSTPIEYIITTPAVWSDSAQAKTRECAFNAGMGKDLQIISEPEAAAIYALHAMDPHSIKIGDTFVLCDAGGGTVDLISYTVTDLKPILKVAEANPGSGRLCGSTFLNRIFNKFIVDKFSLNSEWEDDVVEEAMKRFDGTVKKAFRGKPDEEFIIPGTHLLVQDFD